MLPAADALVQAAEQDVVLVPGELLPGDELGEIGVLRQQGRDPVFDELEIGMEFLLRGIELGTGRFDAGFRLRREGAAQGHQEQVQVPGGLTRDIEKGFRILESHTVVFRVAVNGLESLDTENSSVEHTFKQICLQR